jgi:hypothetical protein
MASGRKPRRDVPKVKVAILDTGVSPYHEFTRRREYLDRYQDFVTKDGEKPDETNTSHGTKSLDLVLRMCEPADVYVAKVFGSGCSSVERDAYRMGEVRCPWYPFVMSYRTTR